jgi:nitrate/nitrite transporter NarK
MCILTGIGNAMAYCPGVIIVSIYFHKKLGTAVGIATSGVGLGAFSVPLLLEASFLYYGYMGSFVLLSGLFLELMVCGALMRPMSVHRRISDKRSRYLFKV